ncbi:polysaccharide biosynthesis protein [Roseobacteraceae bacterium S113]
MNRRQKSYLFLAMDLFLMSFALLTTNALLAGNTSILPLVWPSLPYLAGMLPVAAFFIVAFGIHRVLLIHYDRRSMMHTGIVSIMAALAGMGVNSVIGASVSAHVFVIVAMAYVLFSVTARLVLKELVISVYTQNNGSTRVLVYGAGRTGQQLATALSTDDEIRPVAFVDDDRALHGATISGLKVFPTNRLADRVEELRIDRIVLAMPSVSESEQAAIAKSLSHLPCEVHAMPSFAAMVMNKQQIATTKPLDFSKLLGRNHLEADLPGVRDMYSDKVVLVTGAGGSIGSEICLQIAVSNPKCVILFDQSEIMLYEIERKLSARFPEVEHICVLGSVCNASQLDHLFAHHHIDVVLHAAAYKQLPMLENNAIEALRNNVIGTRCVALAAMRHDVESFILISTDKAVRPTSWLGYSKRFAEMLVQDMATRSSVTRMSMVRFGNVLGSSGSVVPLFQDQIARGGPVTLTHPDVTRFFMTVSEAVRLVLLAGSFSRGGDVFVLDMGEAIRIRDLARNLIEASGYHVRDAATPDGEIEIVVTGLRPGEKIKEELLIGSDMLTTPHPKILRAEELHPSELEMATILQDIARIVDGYDIEKLDELHGKWARYLGLDGASKPPTPTGTLRV